MADDTKHQIASLMAMLDEEDLKPPRLVGESWFIEWQPDPWRPNWICVGAAFFHVRVFCSFVTLKQFRLLGIKRTDFDLLLNTMTSQRESFRTQARVAVKGFRFTEPEETSGDDIKQILYSLMQDGPPWPEGYTKIGEPDVSEIEPDSGSPHAQTGKESSSTSPN